MYVVFTPNVDPYSEYAMNRIQPVQANGTFLTTPSNQIKIIPYLNSISVYSPGTYFYFNLSSIYIANNSYLYTLSIYNNYSNIFQATLSIIQINLEQAALLPIYSISFSSLSLPLDNSIMNNTIQNRGFNNFSI